MAVYKVIQDIEAEDKLVGFLTLKTFIYAIIAAVLGYINFRLAIAPGPSIIKFPLVLILFFPMVLFGILAAPFGRDQPTEVWILSHVRFFLKPRKRIWDQSGIEELVTITVPKKLDRHLTKDFTQREVRSRLKAIATTLDSRGWAVKNVAVNLNTPVGLADSQDDESDRLVNPVGTLQPTVTTDVAEADDIMDEKNNPTAQKFDTMIKSAAVNRRQENINMVKTAEPKSLAQKEAIDYEFLDKVPALDEKGSTTFVGHKIISPKTKNGEEEFEQENKDVAFLNQQEKELLERIAKIDEQIKKAHTSFKPKPVHKKHAKAKPKEEKKPEQPAPVTPPLQADKLKELAQSGSDISVDSVQKLADHVQQIGPNEVEIDFSH
jgi:hypothetical protein